ncbi:SDR family NAD(P)-dependent oxidoreductase [Desertivirga xinjiangensis]|uniref:SDR family NAD(P)-dependent oxidoreductase n=1 Tax=Desertivirga xinjiangensis TaxID=539206 RepID=UPI00210F07EA|nr:SDR family oxidoreductase [Pedobacter xinjiangensis]
MTASSAFSLKGKNILITGASSGIGKATALKCAEYGASLILVGRNAQKLEMVLEKLAGQGHQKLQADLSDPTQIVRLVEQCSPVDGIVHCAGIVEPYPLQYFSRQKVDATFSLNFYAPVQLTSLLLKNKKIKKAGSIVFISSIASQNPFIGGSTYSASKAALEAFARTVAIESAGKLIRANCLSPALVKTPIFDEMSENVAADTVDDHVKRYPLGLGEPDDVAHAAIFLLSDASKWITGVTIRMDGGLLVGS